MAEQVPGADKKIVAGVLGIVLGGLGVHRFYLGDTKGGLIRIAISVVTCGVGSLLGLVEGVIYLTKSDEDFVKTYIQEKKEWL